ncbi:hypothetical protein GRZ55_05150 [Chelativorans sp. ZYF759]|nr:hypothetical protein [Chelativorans sp. ZYF759]
MNTPRPAAKSEQVTRLVDEGAYIAKVPVTLIYEPDDPTDWGPYLSADDALKLDEVRQALRRGDITAAARHGEVFELTKVA